MLIKLGFCGQDAQQKYSMENQHRKMMVVDLNEMKFKPDVDGHAKAHYCYKQKSGYANPHKTSATGLVHRSPPVKFFDKQSKKHVSALRLKGHEAGEVARRTMQQMHQPSMR